PIKQGQHRTIWQEHSAKDFASYESYKRAGILYVFPPFITTRMGQKIGRRPQTQLCGAAQEQRTKPIHASPMKRVWVLSLIRNYPSKWNAVFKSSISSSLMWTMLPRLCDS